ncbi:hypothetical protein ACFVV6_25500 [Bacillus mycoides]|uniref:Uncharacterized protein n=1 Tax=Bacillus mycoides TaxID=1405 RepID=A0A1S9SZ61_BACMY|nr:MULTISPECIES: hypothetical protein [Bacillus]MBJ7961477.1 hypothetical protein [Bacillus cereus group sp. N28]MDI6534938.1 hypothetical protein [Bacillus mycoides]OOR02987.1 hypothetical protein BW900_29430 [Bacillus mycoides]RAN66388.1 hypothetical protein B5P40_31160 [Bacillus sp. SRB_8]WJE61616.1 hypothetical protein QRE64_31220 [Bacillus mycoides]
MNNLAFSPRELGGKHSPFLLTIDEWRSFAQYLNRWISAPTSIDQVKERMYLVLDGKVKSNWDRLITTSTFSRLVEEAIATKLNVREKCRFWDNGGHKDILIIAQNIVAFADLISIKYYNDLNQVISEALTGKLSPNTKSKFINICKDLSNHAQTYYQQSQSLATSLSEFYSEIQKYEEAEQTWSYLMSQLPLQNSNDFVVAQNTVVYLVAPVMSLIRNKEFVLPVIRKVHRIWSAISYDLKELADNIDDIENLEEFIAALELELAFEDWKAIRDEAENFYKNAINIS